MDSSSIEQKILEELSLTKFACARFVLLPSGTTNFVFRGTLKHPLDGAFQGTNPSHAVLPSNTIIVKHLEGFARVAPVLKIDNQRGVCYAFC